MDDVQVLLSLDDGQACSTARSIGERKLADVCQRLKALQALEISLQALVGQCSTSNRKVNCPLIDALTRSADSASPWTRAHCGMLENEA